MLEKYLRLAAVLLMVLVALVFLVNMLTINTAWRRRRRPAGVEYYQGRGVVAGLVLLGVTLLVAVAVINTTF